MSAWSFAIPVDVRAGFVAGLMSDFGDTLRSSKMMSGKKRSPSREKESSWQLLLGNERSERIERSLGSCGLFDFEENVCVVETVAEVEIEGLQNFN